MLKILIGLILVLFFFVVLFFNKIREALSTGGMAVLLVSHAWPVGSGSLAGICGQRQAKDGDGGGRSRETGQPSPVAETPFQTLSYPETRFPERPSLSGASTGNATQSVAGSI